MGTTITIIPTQEQIDFTNEMIDFREGSYISDFVNKRRNKYIGELAETVMADEFGIPRKDFHDCPDKGYDIEVNGVLIDVKAQSEYETDGVISQHQWNKKQSCDYYLFCIVAKDDTIKVIGACSYEHAKKIAVQRPARYSPYYAVPRETLLMPKTLLENDLQRKSSNESTGEADRTEGKA